MGEGDVELAGIPGITLITLVVAVFLYLVGFTTTGWSVKSEGGYSHQVGLWESCSCGDYDWMSYRSESWFEAVQAMMTLGLIFLFLAAIVLGIYIFLSIDIISKSTQIFLVAILAGVAFLFMFIGVCVYGSEASHESYSYVFSIFSMVAVLAVSVMSGFIWKTAD